MPIQFINLDDSYPVQDDYHATNTTGTFRFISASDANRLESIQRFQGDTVRRFILHEDKINEVIQAVNRTPGLVDNSLFALTDGSNPFTEPQGGVTPVLDSHLATKGYVDAGDDAQNNSLATLSLQVAQVNGLLTAVHASSWTPYTWDAGNGVKLTFAVTPGDMDLDNLISITLFERVNINTVGDPVWIYREAHQGGAFGVDDLAIRGSNASTVEVYIPNSTYIPSYGDASFLNVVARELRVVVTTGEACDIGGSSSSSSESSSSSSSS